MASASCFSDSGVFFLFFCASLTNSSDQLTTVSANSIILRTFSTSPGTFGRMPLLLLWHTVQNSLIWPDVRMNVPIEPWHVTHDTPRSGRHSCHVQNLYNQKTYVLHTSLLEGPCDTLCMSYLALQRRY